MKMFISRPTSILIFFSVALLSLGGLAHAATVGPAGYTNDFSVRPAASDWATLSLVGGAGDVYDLDNEVLTNLNINATLVSLVTVSNNNNPATQLTNATWSSNANGLYLQTRPNGNRATLLMGKFVNGTATNAAEIRLAYQLTMAGPLSIEDAGKGTHVYYSLTGLGGSWSPLPSLHNLTNTGSFALSTNLAVSWPVGGSLYLLWLDDNSASSIDSGNQIDNFSLAVTVGAQPALAVHLNAPTNGALLVAGPAFTASSTASFGTAPHTVQYFISSGAGNTAFTPVGSSATPPFNANLGALAAGTYNLYAGATDSAGSPESATSATNTFFVLNTITLALTAPANGVSFDYSVSVSATATVAGGTAPYSVQFFLDSLPSGAPVGAAPYQLNFGPLPIGDHTISATITDARGWVSNSVAHTVHITGPLSVTLTPTNGTTLTVGQSLTLAATPLGGTAPYSVSFYTNGQLAGTLSAGPYTLNLGAQPVGSYTCYVHVSDSSLPAAQQADSTTHVITVSPPPLLVALTAPTGGQIVTAGLGFNLTASASVGAPLVVSNVEFFLDGASAGVDSGSPYSVAVTLAAGSHTAYAVATDSLGRTSHTPTNSFTAIVPANASVVGPTGYTNDFSTQPMAVEWATLSIAAAAADAYTVDADVNTSITLNNVTNRTTSAAGDPPLQLATAVWSSTAFYLQTRPTGNRYNVLMGRFLNQTGTNATQLNVSYLFTLAGPATAEDAEKGTRAYYSLSGQTGSWVNIPAFNTTAAAASSVTLSTNLNINWTNGGHLYLLWADDNAQGAGGGGGGGTDTADQYDNFSLTVTAGLPPAFAALLTAPTNTQLFVSGTLIPAVTAVAHGTSPYTVEYFTNSGVGNTVFTGAGTTTTPFALNLGGLAAGDYNIYAVATDSALVSTNSLTNTFRIADPIALALTSPADNTTLDNLTPVTGVTSVGGGTPPYSVQFFFDNSPSGPALTSSPYERNFGALLAGDHTIRATVTDARGWVSNSLVSTVHITGPLGASLVPTHGAVFSYGSSISLTGIMGGGSAPYAADFYVNELSVGSGVAAPFVVSLGRLAEGSYTGYVHATDSSLPAPQQYNSATNVFTIVPNPIGATLTTPLPGASGTAGASIALAATATVSAPLAITNVEFFYDGALIGADASAPYAGSLASPAAGVHAFTAVATDSLGRRGTSAVSTVTFVTDPLANNNFDSRFALSTPASVAGNNTGATTQQGEPTFQFGGGQPTIIWGATLWYKWVATINGVVTIDTFGSSINTVLNVYTGAAVNALTLVQRNDNANASTTASLVSFGAVAGTEYQIQVAGQGGFGSPSAQGALQLNLSVPASVAVTSPTNGSVFLVGTNIGVTVTASSTASTITQVSLYDGPTFLGTVAAAPYTFVISNAPPGSNSLYAVATDSLSQIVTSGVVRVLVANYGLTITSPNEDAIFQGTNPITAAVFTILPAGAITNVNFFIDGQPFGQDTTAPFSLAWSNVTGGSHRLSATGRDDAGNTYVATPVNFGVGTVLVHSNAVWNYLADGSDQGTAWRAINFDDSSWASGPAELGYGDADEATIVPSGPTGAFYITTYFRRAFTVNNINSFTNLSVLLAYDDAGVVYLNGREVFRGGNLPTPVLYNSLATGQAVEETVATGILSATNLIEGLNEVAVEVHQQAANSSDISFFLQLVGTPVIIHNVSPLVAITTPTNGQYFLAPSSVLISADASDSDGSVSKVEFFADGVKLGESTNGSPYEFVWNNPPVAAHVLTAVARDNQNAATVSAPISIVVYDAVGTPVAAFTNPLNGAVMEGPTNLLFTATAHAINGVTNVEFLVDGVPFGNDPTAPYTAVWPSMFLNHSFVAIVTDANGGRGTSPVVNLTITIPPTNVIAPTISTQLPPAYASLTNLTNITIRFSERVQHVDASDLLVNNLPATGVTGSGSNYTFNFPHPAYGHVDVKFAPGHGITDFGYPENLAFNEFDDAAIWSYELSDTTPPRVATKTPNTGAAVTNLAEIAVTFSEGVGGVNASDLLVNGVPAFGFSGSGSNYVFQVAQPASGTITVSWATNHDIFDFADLPNSFVRTAAGNSWTFTLDSRTTFIHSNSTWRFLKGFAEASDPTNAWRALAFDDSSWSNAAAPFFYGDPYTNFPAGIFGTELTDMRSNYSSIFLRKTFVVVNRSIVTNLLINAQSDDGYIAWLNGVEVRRYNAPAGEPAYNSLASASATEANNNASYLATTLTNNAVAALVNGTNILTIQAFNSNLTNDNDFAFNAQLYSFLPDTTVTPPRLAFASPVAGDVFYLTNIILTFSEDVTNVEAADLLVNGLAAASVVVISNSIYSFTFPQPPYGTVALTWATNHGIIDLDPVPKPFDGNAASAKVNYLLVNPSAPVVSAQVPIATMIVTGLTSIAITLSEPVTGVDVADLLINGVPATGLNALSATDYVFTFPQPAFGTVTVRFATNSGITDLELPPTDLDATRPANRWSYTLINPVPTVAITNPVNNAFVLQGANVTLTATATDNDGTIAQVAFSVSGANVGTVLTPPYSIVLSNLGLATYTLTAVATDNSGLMGTSAPVVLNVVTSLPIVLLRGPYLLAGSPTGGVVRWRTDVFSDAVVRYGPDPMNLTNFAVQSMLTNNHIVQVGGLEPDTKYYYSFGSAGQTLAGGTNTGSSNYWFTTSPVAGTPKPTRFWVLGDPGTATANQRAVRDSYYNFVTTNRPADIWMMLGDNAYNSGTDTEYQSAVFTMYPETLRNYFLYPVLGNHETAQSTSTTITYPYLDIFSMPQNGEAGGVPSGNQKYYSFDYANVHFVALDSMTSGRATNSPMVLWLKDDLAANTQTWTIVYFHHSLYTKGTHDSDSESDLVLMRQNFNPILEAYGVDLVLMGHSHVYERSYLLDGHYGLSGTLTPSMKIDAGSGREEGTGAYRKSSEGRGVVYSIVGSSGQALGGPLNHPAHFVSVNLLGSLIVDVTSNRLDATFLSSTGSTTNDHYTLIKRNGNPPDAPINIASYGLGTNQVELTWTDVATNELGYYIDRSLDGTNFSRVATNGVNATGYLDTGLLANRTYYYRVIAFNGAGDSSLGSANSAFTGNRAPSLAAISNYVADVTRSIVFRSSATDPDRPANGLTFSLDPGAPGNATINPTNGRFIWMPGRDLAATTNALTVRVTDDATPALSDGRSFTVIVRDFHETFPGSATVRAGGLTNVPIDFYSSTALSNLVLTLPYPSDRLTGLTLENLVPSLADATLDVLTTPGAAQITFAARPGQGLSGTQHLARLHFTAAAGQSSAFVPLTLNNAVGLRAQPGLAPSALLHDGRVVVLGSHPLLEALPGLPRVLSIYGLPGRTYLIEKTPTPASPASWLPWQSVLIVEPPYSLNASADTNAAGIYYRMREINP